MSTPPQRDTPEGRAAEVRRIMEGPRHLLRIFYVGVLTIALIGQSQAAHHWLNWWYPAATAAVLAVEVGGVAVLAYADARRQLKERASLARLLSAGIAAGSVAVNWFGHAHPGHPNLQAGFFAGMSALGYLVWLIDSEARRRDRLRITGDLAEAPPSYEWMLWLRHPFVTSRARSLAKANATLGRYGSWNLAAQQLREERRNKKIAAVMGDTVGENAEDSRVGQIAALTFDMEEVARRITSAADYDRLAQIMIDKLTPEKLTGSADPDQSAVSVSVGAPVRVSGQPPVRVSPRSGSAVSLTGQGQRSAPGQSQPPVRVSGQPYSQPVSRSAVSERSNPVRLTGQRHRSAVKLTGPQSAPHGQSPYLPWSAWPVRRQTHSRSSPSRMTTTRPRSAPPRSA